MKICMYSVSQKMLLKDMCDFFNPKNVTIGSSIDQNKKLPSYWPISEKTLFFNGKLSLVIQNTNFSCKMGIFWPMSQ